MRYRYDKRALEDRRIAERRATVRDGLADMRRRAERRKALLSARQAHWYSRYTAALAN